MTLSTTLFGIVQLLLDVAYYVLIVQAVLSWLIAFNVINTYNEGIRSVYVGLQKLTEPLYRPIRRILPDFGALDLSPLVVILIILILRNFIVPYLFDLFQTAPAPV